MEKSTLGHQIAQRRLRNGQVLARYEEMCTSDLREIIARSGLTYDEVNARLSKIGYSESRQTLSSKIRKGTYSAAFERMILDVLGISKT